MRTRNRHRLVSCPLVVAIAATTFAVAASASAPSRITNCNSTASRPKLLTLTCGDGNTVLKGMTWSSFGGSTAQGTGTFVTNTCNPNCAQGRDVSYAVSAKATNARRCRSGVKVYEKLTLTFPRRKPSASIPRTWKLGCPT
jgi:hypothetical protein